MFKKSRRLNLVLLFLAVAALLVISFAFIFEIGTRAARVVGDLLQRQSTVQGLAAIVTAASDAETGQRGYLLTADEKYLAPYTNALSEMPARMGALRKAAAEGLVSAQDVDKIDQLVSAKFSELAKTVDLKRQHRDGEAVAVVNTGQGKQLMNEIRNSCDQIVETQQTQINSDLGETIRDSKIRSLLYFGGLVVNLGFLGWVCWRIFAEMGARDAAAKAIDEQREYLDVTLASIGDGVIVTDAKGTVTFLNEVAQQLSGWSQQDAKGRPCAEIFHIVNETTRTIQENPVDKVLMTGRIVGLANHTVLIRRDGSEIPIDDSGAPIRNKDGTIAGVVLVFRDFSDQKKSAEAMTAVKNELEKANQAKDEFLAALSHELRAPLTPIIATLNRWQAQKRLDKEMLAELTMLQRNAALEARLVDDLLDIARITQRKMPLSRQVMEITVLVRAALEMVNDEVRDRKMRVAVNSPTQPLLVDVDPARIQQVFWNILKNALKFTQDGGCIDIETSSTSATSVSISFTDNGIGMSSQTLGRIFQPFEQGAEQLMRSYSGLGLGLAISKSLVEAHGGTISAASAGHGTGSTFLITLPKAFRSATIAPDPASNEILPVGLGSLRVLMIEDHEDTAIVMAHMLGDMGHKVVSANSVASAVDILTRETFDLIVSDIGLPDGNGVSLIHAVRSFCQAPAIALTGYGMREDVERCLNAGFNRHVTKPVTFDTLRRTIAEVCAEKASQEATE
ncbi:MAG: CHASE3 domain-containing protein [Verrucomicrobia bacterium]|nr:CHASE3 domain-containing protein [Verrucomicrobiota bacterium]